MTNPLITLRRNLLSRPLLGAMKGVLPSISSTERIALEAGSVGWDRDLLSGKPDWGKLAAMKVKPLTKEEQAFMDGPLQELCAMITDWDFNQKRDLPKKVWDFIKKEKFLGMVIPKAHGGLGFGANAHAQVVSTLSTRSVALAVIVMVPNSLGPGELLIRYGTDAQKKHYLPRLADGRDVPCFALTEPHAGSDAANGTSFGVVTEGLWKGKKTLGVSLTFNKRYITLAPIASVVGLAFKLQDPKGLLAGKGETGITCALLPRDLPGLKIGERHDPVGCPFPNGPLSGKNVFIPMEFIIGGQAMAGQGWRMLMEALAAGRGISLPSLSVGASQLATLSSATYTGLRQQFGLHIGAFEGIRERLAFMAGMTYAIAATRWLTCGYIDAGEHPVVLSAISKEKLTTTMRTVMTDGMDIFGGAAICRGPRNILGRGHTTIPIAITVEGANILTRSLIIFGQGALRSHPYLQAEVNAMTAKDVTAFDKALFGHIGHALCTVVRAAWYLVTGGGLIRTKGFKGELAGHARTLTRLSNALALTTELALATLGGSLKRKEYLSGRYADAFSWLYIASASLKYAHAHGATAEHKLALRYVMAHASHEMDTALRGVLRNHPAKLFAGLVRFLLFPTGSRYPAPHDRLTDKVASALLAPKSELLALVSTQVYAPKASEDGLGALLETGRLWFAAGDAMTKLKNAVRTGKLAKAPLLELALAGHKAGVIAKAELVKIQTAEAARDNMVQVDSFKPEVYAGLR